LFVGKPYEAKVSRTVWSRGKAGDYFKGLPMAMRFLSGLINKPKYF
jgi:hypothetical protein